MSAPIPDAGSEAGIRSLLDALFLRPEQRSHISPDHYIPMKTPQMDYRTFLDRKSHFNEDSGFAPLWMPDALFDFQAALVEWAIRKGRAALYADTGTGKTLMQLVFAENVVRKTNKRVLILTPLAVGSQTLQEGEKFGIACQRSRDGQFATDAKIVITNYERLHYFSPTDFVGTICDESGILKHFSGATQKAVTRFMAKHAYRLLCTATPAPNDFIELGTSSEALGYLGYSDMLTRFFVMDDKKRHRMNDVKLARQAHTGNYYQKLAYRVAQQIGAWRLKGHAEEPFWQWVCSWARACRKPSDLGFDDGPFQLPPLIEQHHEIEPRRPAEGMLFTIPAFGLQEERDERRRTLQERCEKVRQLVDHPRPAVVWCHYNAEGDLLEKIIPDARQISGSMPDEEKEEVFEGFGKQQLRVVVIKPKIGAWGLNWQFCNHVVTFASHSYEQFYQSVRRCYRFGQTRPVTVDILSTTGEQHLRENMLRKSKAAEQMFSNLVRCMNHALSLSRPDDTHSVQVPSWLQGDS